MKISIVDDDYAAAILGENLEARGFEVTIFRTCDEALDNIDRLAKSDLVILDLIMPPGGKAAGSFSGGRHSGMSVYRELRKTASKTRIVVHTACLDPDVKAVFDQDANATFHAKWNSSSLTDFIGVINSVLNLETKRPLHAFIVHGHDDTAKLELKNYLQNTLEIRDVVVLHEQPSRGQTVIEKFEYFAARTTLAFVLLTPDDKSASAGDTDDFKYRARQNVILELGYFLGLLGRRSGRVVLLHKGPLEIPSDLKGVIYIDISNGVAAAGEHIRKELSHVL